jgi:hypothetical protein
VDNCLPVINYKGPRTVAKFIAPDWGDKVNFGIGLSYRPAGYIGCQAGTTAYDGVNYIPQSETMNLATGRTIALFYTPRGVR